MLRLYHFKVFHKLQFNNRMNDKNKIDTALATFTEATPKDAKGLHEIYAAWNTLWGLKREKPSENSTSYFCMKFKYSHSEFLSSNQFSWQFEW